MTAVNENLLKTVAEGSANQAAAQAAATATTVQASREPRRLALLSLTAVFIGLCVLLAAPFFPAITWGVALAIIAWPLHRWMRRRVAPPALAAFFSTAVVAAVIVSAATFVTYQLARETGSAADLLRANGADGSIRSTIEKTPILGQVVAWMDRIGLDFEAEVRNLIAAYTRDFGSLAQGSVAALLQFLIAVYILFHLFLDRADFLNTCNRFLPLSGTECEQVTTSAADSVHANLHATLLTSTIDTIGGGLMFWALGLPAPMIWAVAMFILALLPVVGAAMVWVPAAVFLALSGRGLAAAALCAWGIATFIIVDNLLYARLASRGMRLHPVPALIAFLGGLAVFGVSGMILGPAILAVTIAFLEVWKRRLAGTGPDNELSSCPTTILPRT